MLTIAPLAKAARPILIAMFVFLTVDQEDENLKSLRNGFRGRAS
jgi:hypothetical protein